MDEEALALIVDRCLVAIKEGNTAAAAAARYPSVEHEILPLLEVAEMLSEGTGFMGQELPPELQRLKLRMEQSPA